ARAAVGQVPHTLDAISTAAAEQQNGIAQINEAVSHMDGITQQNAAMVEQLAASSTGLSSQVESVSNSMRLFRLRAGEASMAEQDAVAMRREMRQAAAPAKPAPRPAPAPRSAAKPARAAPAPVAATSADDEWTEI
ncbi:MAG: chemotaxis protein, partial [Betaproteobacteria bacterium]